MSELQNKLNSLLQQINDKKYEGVTWADGQNPPLSAEHLNKSEDALRELLTVFNSSSDGGIIQQLLTLLIAESLQREQHDVATDKSLNTLTNQDTLFTNALISTNESVTSNTTKINNNIEILKSLNGDVSNLKTDVTDLQTNVANNTTNITSLQQDLDNIQENVEGLIGDKVVQDGDEVILRCGTSTTVLFDFSE